MIDFVAAAATAFGIVFIAELGDKTQLLALDFGARHPMRVVALGLLIGYAVAGAIAAAVGGLLGATLPERPLSIVAGLLFVGFAVVTLRGGPDEADDGGAPSTRVGHVVASIAVTIALAEFGDKTQIATAALAAQNQPVGTWAGATAGVLAAGMIGALAGRRLGGWIDPRLLRLLSAAVFATVGVLLLATA